MKRVWISLVIVIVIAAVVVGLRMRQAGEGEGIPVFETVRAERGPIRVIVSATGVLEPIYQLEVKSKASGMIEVMPVEEGDRIREGDLLAELDKTEAQGDFDQARANLASAEANLRYLKTQLERQRELYEKGLISDLEMDETNLELVRAESQKVAAEAALTTARQRLDDTVVRSPIDGVVLQKWVEAGQIISSGISSYTGGTTIAVVADMSEMLVRTSVDEVDIGHVDVGQTASVTPDAFPDWTSGGRVIRISPLGVVESNVTTFEVTVQIPNPDLRLKAGMNSTVDLLVAEREDAVLVPAEALAGAQMLPRWKAILPVLELPEPAPDAGASPRGGGTPAAGFGIGPESADRNGKFVIVREDGAPAVRRVRTGLDDMERVEIVEGLEEGEEVLIASLSRALEARAEFQERMRQRSMSGFRRSN